MIPIPQYLTRNGHRYRLLKRTSDWCLWKLNVNGSRTLTSYEVSKVVRCPEKTFPTGHVCPAHEALPSDEQIGRGHGWAPSDLKEAERLFNEAVQAVHAEAA